MLHLFRRFKWKMVVSWWTELNFIRIKSNGKTYKAWTTDRTIYHSCCTAGMRQAQRGHPSQRWRSVSLSLLWWYSTQPTRQLYTWGQKQPHWVHPHKLVVTLYQLHWLYEVYWRMRSVKLKTKRAQVRVLLLHLTVPQIVQKFYKFYFVFSNSFIHN